jgi:hypothetical protein
MSLLIWRDYCVGQSPELPFLEIMAAWRTGCPRLLIWEDACLDGLIESETGTPSITVSAKGLVFIEETRRS